MDILKNILFYLKNKFDDFYIYIHERINIKMHPLTLFYNDNIEKKS